MKTERQTGADRRQSLLQAALDLFSTQGYEGTTTRAVAERVGVTEALLFKHFKTKQELLRAVVAEFGPRRQLPASFEELRTMPVREALDRVITEYLDAFWANRAYLRMMILETWRDPQADQELRDQFAERTRSLIQMLTERSLCGELRSEVALATTDVISAATTGFLFRSLRSEPTDWSAARMVFVHHLLRILFDGVKPS